MPVAFGSSTKHFGHAVVSLVCLTVCLISGVEACGGGLQQPAVESAQLHHEFNGTAAEACPELLSNFLTAAELIGCGRSTTAGGMSLQHMEKALKVHEARVVESLEQHRLRGGPIRWPRGREVDTSIQYIKLNSMYRNVT